MEPSLATLREIGRLCIAWSYFERVSEIALRTVLRDDDQWNELIESDLDIRRMWERIVSEAERKLPKGEIVELRLIVGDLATVKRDRNIIVHGVVGAILEMPNDETPPVFAAVPASAYKASRVPCWTINKGTVGGKNFPISTEAVTIVLDNIIQLSRQTEAFNTRLGCVKGRGATENIETGWPTSLKRQI